MNSPKVSILKKVPIPDLTPLPMGAPVTFFAPTISTAIDRGVARLKAVLQRDPLCASWIVFGWIDGGLTSSFVSNPIGAFSFDGKRVFYSPMDQGDPSPHFSIEFNNDWEEIAGLSKATLIQGYEHAQSRSTAGNLTVGKVVNIDPTK